MVTVFDPNDIAKVRRKIFENAVRDISPARKERILRIFETWKGQASEEELEEILGQESAKELRDLLDNHTVGDLSSNQVDNLRRLFRESVTFD